MHGTLRFLYLSHLLYGICVKIFIVNRYYFKELHNEQEYYRPTICITGAAVVSTITSNILNVCYWVLGSYCLVFTQENHSILLYAQIPMTIATFFDLAVYSPSSETQGQSVGWR